MTGTVTLVLDMDCVLIKGESFTTRALQAIERLQEKDSPFVIATGDGCSDEVRITNVGQRPLRNQ
ncbi:hypothetical protein ANO14919_064640 [Xylariales sp. No.14919]|nr:hypothetical protein ANO14919_064640 [Xylariales sp. No.14919]